MVAVDKGANFRLLATHQGRSARHGVKLSGSICLHCPYRAGHRKTAFHPEAIRQGRLAGNSRESGIQPCAKEAEPLPDAITIPRIVDIEQADVRQYLCPEK